MLFSRTRNAAPAPPPVLTPVELRLLALVPAAGSVRRETAPRPESRERGLASRPLISAAAILLVAAAAITVPLAILRGDGAQPSPAPAPVAAPALPQAPARALNAAMTGSGRVDLTPQGESVHARVAVRPAVRTLGGWFWCIDAEPPLPAEDRECASNGAWQLDGFLIAERSLPADAGRRYYVALYCEHSCDWGLEPPSDDVLAARE